MKKLGLKQCACFNSLLAYPRYLGQEPCWPVTSYTSLDSLMTNIMWQNYVADIIILYLTVHDFLLHVLTCFFTILKVKKIKAIYHTMNMFNLDVTQKCLIAECWCPVSDLDKIQQALQRGTERSGAAIPSILNCLSTPKEPPTFNRTNKFTQGFQAIVDAYGVAKYREVNPGILHSMLFLYLHDHRRHLPRASPYLSPLVCEL